MFEPAAADELRRAILRYETERAGLGVELADVVESVLKSLASGSPRSVTVSGVPNEVGARRVLIDRFPFAIVHLESEDVVHVVAVAHLRRRPGYWRRRVRVRSRRGVDEP